MSLACLAHVNFFAAHLLFDVITEQINDDDDDYIASGKKCRSMTAVSRNVRFVQIFAGVP